MIAGFVRIARAGLSALIRALASVPLWLGNALSLVADLLDPDMPESIWRPREWLPRLWSRWHTPDSSEIPH